MAYYSEVKTSLQLDSNPVTSKGAMEWPGSQVQEDSDQSGPVPARSQRWQVERPSATQRRAEQSRGKTCHSGGN